MRLNVNICADAAADRSLPLTNKNAQLPRNRAVIEDG
jgi:hypothetical protein